MNEICEVGAPGERPEVPRVNFAEIATKAVKAGIFAPDPDASDQGEFFPASMLEVPYVNGPFRIKDHGIDVPEAAMDRVRKNFVTANRLLLPREQVMLSFHEQFTHGDIFGSQGVREVLEKYEHSLPYNAPELYAEASLSFQTEDVDRSTYERRLFTEDETMAGIELERDHPLVALSVAGYQGAILNYLHTLGDAFEGLKPSMVTDQDVVLFKEKYIRAWETQNFILTLMPSLAVQLQKAAQADPKADAASLLTPKLFHDAITFSVKNGAFRHFVDVPAKVADDGKYRVNHFLCPAVGTIREQLLDGSVLHRVYELAQSRVAAGDWSAIDAADTIRQRATGAIGRYFARKQAAEKYAEEEAKPIVEIASEGKNLATLCGEAIGKAMEKNKPAVLTWEGTTYGFDPQAIEAALHFDSPLQPGDVEVETMAGDWLSGVITKTIIIALQEGYGAYFDFNGKLYRADPEEISAFVEQILNQQT